MRELTMMECNVVSGGDAAATRPPGSNSWGEPYPTKEQVDTACEKLGNLADASVTLLGGGIGLLLGPIGGVAGTVIGDYLGDAAKDRIVSDCEKALTYPSDSN
jgi:hypothetical protein